LGFWLRRFYFYIFVRTLPKVVGEAPQQTNPNTLRIWWTLGKPIFIPNLLHNRYKNNYFSIYNS